MTREARKRHSVVQGSPLPRGVVDEIVTDDAVFFDSDTGEWVATYRTGVTSHLRDLAWSFRGKQVYGTTPEDFPEELQPWVDLCGLGKGCAGIITENAPETPVHWDSWTTQGEIPNRATALSFYTEGEYTGGEYVLAEYGIGFDLRDGNMLMAPTTTLHGNLPRVGEDYIRLGVIFCVDGTEAIKAS